MTRDTSVLGGILEQIFPGVVFRMTRQARPLGENELRPKRMPRAPGWSKQRRAIRGNSDRLN